MINQSDAIRLFITLRLSVWLKTVQNSYGPKGSAIKSKNLFLLFAMGMAQLRFHKNLQHAIHLGVINNGAVHL